MKKICLRSPAKLNLFLKVLNKRPDGYHNLKTIFERIDLCDDMEFFPEPSGKIRITCDHPQVPVGPKNLAFQAARLLKEQTGVLEGVHIRIHKRIPVAAGLAGGSSNGATTLLGLNKMWALGLGTRHLIKMGGLLGADVPFFLHDCSWGLGTERGDVIRPLPISAKLWHILVVPRVKMYSREVFTAFNLQLTKRDDNANILIRSLKDKNISKIEELLSNDLESSILRIRPALLRAKEKLKACHLKGVSFSGSGPSVFGLVRSKNQAEGVKKELSQRYSQVLAVRTY